MGKSMQGAGGAIVLGTVVNSILTRNRNLRIPLHPKEWLAKMFNELQDVFVEFDGSMLISCFVGLINHSTGKMFYFNCEHPHAILYRDGKAQFIMSKPEFKIGSPMYSENYRIQIMEFSLYSNDIIFTGSDGRDDIRILQKNGTYVINEDENQILRIVEFSNANIDKIYENIEKLGEPIDDISFIKISFFGKELAEEERKLDISLVKRLIKSSKYKAALEELESTEEELMSEEFIYLRILCLEKIGLGTVALSLLERHQVILKNYLPSQHLKALIYYRSGDYEKAKHVLENCLDSQISNSQTIELLDKVEYKLSQIHSD